MAPLTIVAFRDPLSLTRSCVFDWPLKNLVYINSHDVGYSDVSNSGQKKIMCFPVEIRYAPPTPGREV